MYDINQKTMKIIDFGSGVRFENSEIKPRKRVGTVPTPRLSLTTSPLKS
jgi:hypothetical protein